MSRSVRGGTRVQKFRTPLVQIVNADLGGERCVLLCQLADQRHAASFCAAEEHNTADSVEVVEVGTRGRARRAQTAARCPTWVRGACWCSGSPAARWTGTRYFVVSELQETSHCAELSCRVASRRRHRRGHGRGVHDAVAPETNCQDGLPFCR